MFTILNLSRIREHKVKVKLDLYCNKVSQLLDFLTYIPFIHIICRSSHLFKIFALFDKVIRFYPIFDLLKQTNMKKAFKVYKQGTTDNWVTILIPIAEFTQEILQFKIDKYLSLGYKVEMI